MRHHGLLMILAIFVGLTGCGDFMDMPGPGDDRTAERLAPGYTPCGDAPNQSYGVICHPNQYCSSQTFANCSTGCLSNDNCTDEQRCFKQYNQDVGTCVDRGEDVDNQHSSGGEDNHSESQNVGENDGDDPSSEQGYTTCGTGVSQTTCHPNQYCADDYWGDCELGCLSNDNCAGDQRCDKQEGEHVGICVDDESS